MHIMAIDNSGSTSGKTNKYWTMVKEIVTKTAEDTKFILWNSNEIKKYTERGDFIPELKITMGGCTDPITFIPWLRSDDSGRLALTLVTDGQIAPSGRNLTEDQLRQHVEKCDKLLSNLNILFSELTIYFISTDSNNQSMNLSVSAPFIRRANQYKLEVYNLTQTCSGLELMLDKDKSRDISTRLNLERYFNEPVQFNSDAERILEQIKLENAGRTPKELLALKESLINLRKNLNQKILSDKKEQQGDEDPYAKLRGLLTTENSFNQAVELIKTITDPINPAEPELKNSPDLATLVNKNIQQMIAVCDQGIGFSFKNSNHNHRLERAEPNNHVVNPSEIPELELENGAYECAIICDASTPLLLVRKTNKEETPVPVFSATEKKSLNKYIDNPLLTLAYPEFTQKINLVIDGHIGLLTVNELVQLKKSSTKFEIESPYSRKKIASFISMGNSESDKKATQFALSEIFFGEKKLVGLPALWLAVVYFFLEENKRYNKQEEDIAFMAIFKASLIDQLKSDRSRITLSGDPNVKPFMECPVDIALWYCAISPRFHEDGINNRLRGVVTKYHLKLLDLLGYPYSKELTIRRLMRYQIFAIMMREEKENSSNLRNWLRCLYQNSTRLENGRIILLDGKSDLNPESFRVKIEIIDLNTPKKPEDYLRELPVEKSGTQNNQHDTKSTLKLIKETEWDKTSDEAMYSLPIQELYALEKLLDSTKTLGAITIPNDLILEPIPVPIKNYGYTVEDKPFEENLTHNISPDTMRPPVVDHSGKYWKVQAKEKFGCEISEQLSVYRFYENFVREKLKYPTQDEFINYIADKQVSKMGESKYTLPKNIDFIVNTVISDYSEAIKKVSLDAEGFIRKIDQSKPLSKRFKLDGSDLRLLQKILSETTNRELNDEVKERAKKTFYQESLEFSNGENKIYKDEKTFNEAFEGLLEKSQQSCDKSKPSLFFNFEGTNASAASNTPPANTLQTAGLNR